MRKVWMKEGKESQKENLNMLEIGLCKRLCIPEYYCQHVFHFLSWTCHNMLTSPFSTSWRSPFCSSAAMASTRLSSDLKNDMNRLIRWTLNHRCGACMQPFFCTLVIPLIRQSVDWFVNWSKKSFFFLQNGKFSGNCLLK